MIRRTIVVIVLLATCLTLSACTSSSAPIPTPSAAQVIGTWHHGDDVIRINADGTFAAAGMPRGVIDQTPVASGAAPHGPTESLNGTWSIGSGGTDVGGAPGVQLDFVSPKKIGYNYGLTLIVAATRPLQLYVTLGRPDSNVRYVFTRE
jgi:hypothetical protein